MRPYAPVTPELTGLIRNELGPGAAVIAPESASGYGRDESGLIRAPELVVLPGSTEDVRKLLLLANRRNFPVTPRGAGTGLAGGCVPAFGGAVLSLERMNRVLSVSPADMTAVVQPGVITGELKKRTKACGLFYPPDPASLDTCTIGGNAATNAGGPACVKYGVTRHYVLGLVAVLPDGEIIRAGAATRKCAVGYDLAQLIVGSEGTLGVITELTLRLIPNPPAVSALAAVFPNLAQAMRAVTRVMTKGHLPSALEFMDHKCLALVGGLSSFKTPDPGAALLLIETDGSPEQARLEAGLIAQTLKEQGATHIAPAEDETERAALWEVRRSISTRIHEHADIYIPEDVAVPIGRIADLADALPDIEQKYALDIFAFGHAGDGNIHLNITTTKQADPELIERGVTAILKLVIQMGGTISGEHGIGLAKIKYLPLELADKNRRLQTGIKRLFDPNMILNPGKIFED